MIEEMAKDATGPFALFGRHFLSPATGSTKSAQVASTPWDLFQR